MFRIPRRAAWTTWDPNSKLYLELRGRARVIITYIAASGIVLVLYIETSDIV